jgi:hypothetical protein
VEVGDERVLQSTEYAMLRIAMVGKDLQGNSVKKVVLVQACVLDQCSGGLILGGDVMEKLNIQIDYPKQKAVLFSNTENQVVVGYVNENMMDESKKEKFRCSKRREVSEEELEEDINPAGRLRERFNRMLARPEEEEAEDDEELEIPNEVVAEVVREIRIARADPGRYVQNICSKPSMAQLLVIDILQRHFMFTKLSLDLAMKKKGGLTWRHSECELCSDEDNIVRLRANSGKVNCTA